MTPTVLRRATPYFWHLVWALSRLATLWIVNFVCYSWYALCSISEFAFVNLTSDLHESFSFGIRGWKLETILGHLLTQRVTSRCEWEGNSFLMMLCFNMLQITCFWIICCLLLFVGWEHVCYFFHPYSFFWWWCVDVVILQFAACFSCDNW